MSDTNAAVDTAEKPARKPRGPRGEITVGDLKAAYRLMGRAGLDQIMAAHQGSDALAKALKLFAREEPAVAEILGLKDAVEVDFRNGVFVHLAALGAKKGDKVKVTQTDENTVTLTIQR